MIPIQFQTTSSRRSDILKSLRNHDGDAEDNVDLKILDSFSVSDSVKTIFS